MDNLSKIAQHHEEYIKYINKMGVTSHAEDLVQEMYLRLVQYDCVDRVILDDGKVNKSYVWRTLRNLLSSYETSAKKFKFVDIEDVVNLESEQQDTEREEAYERVMQKVFRELNELDEDNKYPYNKELFTLYVESAMSMRCLSSVTDISLTSI